MGLTVQPTDDDLSTRFKLGAAAGVVITGWAEAGPRAQTGFRVGEVMRVKEGPFTDLNGSVEEINYEKSRVRVSVMIFGRSTPVELEFGQVEKT